jgi:hypothetical protein
MLNHTPRGSADYRVMSRDVTDKPTHGRAFQAAFGASDSR